MSVHKSKRSEPKLHVHVELRRLVRHTLAKTSNSNKFGRVKRYEIDRDEAGLVTAITETSQGSRDTLARHLQDAALHAAEHAWQANDVMVGKGGQNYATRRALQDACVRDLDNLLMLINVAREECGLSGREARYWTDLTESTRGLVRNWRDADARRYRTSA